MKIGIDMGHSLSGAGSGAVGVRKETDMNRLVGKRLITMLQEKGHTVVNCTVDSASSTDNQLIGVVNRANAQNLDLFVSLHLNCHSNPTANGVETYIWNGSWGDKESNRSVAKKVNDELASRIGWYNRGVKEANYYVLRATKSRAILVELGFCSNKNDMDKWNTENICRAIFKAIVGSEYSGTTSTPNNTTSSSEKEDWNNTEIKRYAENGKCYVQTTLNFRDKPSTNTGIIQGQYYANESVNYDLVVLTNRYVWISWVGASGSRRYMAIKDKSTNERWGNCV